MINANTSCITDTLYNKIEYFEKQFKESDPYQMFVSQNSWLLPYGVFRFLKDLFKGKSWEKWPEKYQNPTDKLISALYKNHTDQIDFYLFLQYLCFQQLSKIKDKATKLNLFLKGDMPILINRDSCDVWYYRSFFNLQKIAGAPPDDFNFKGHKWGFPIFNWDSLKSKNYSWWLQKLDVYSSIYHVYRVDHAVGFFRLWAIDPKKKATEGAFLPKDPATWQEEGKSHFMMLLNFSSLFPIAEDLGFIPKTVYTTLKKLGICGTKVPRWQRITPMQDYEPLSLITLSTHDIETLSGWWKSNKEDAKTLCDTNKWKYEPKLSFDLRKKILYDVHHSSSLFHINLLQEYLAFFPTLSRKNPRKERINISGTVNKTNWTYKYKPSIEEIISHQELKNLLKEIISSIKPY